MKPKILLSLIIAIAMISVASFFVCKTIERSQINRENQAITEAKEAGYDSTYYISAREGTLQIDGITYDKYVLRRSALIGEGYKAEFIIRQDAQYIDESKGNTDHLMIYGRTTGYANDPNDDVTYDPGRYQIIEPYKIEVYQDHIDMLKVITVLFFVAVAELILIILLVVQIVRGKKN